jgi:hypothetical protein
VLAESDDQEEIIARVAALDIGKAELVCCVRLPAPTRPPKASAGGLDAFDDDLPLVLRGRIGESLRTGRGYPGY